MRQMRPTRRSLVMSVVATVTLLSGFLAWERFATADPLAVVEGEALDVSADRVDVDVERGTALLQGNVATRLGELEVHCPTVEIRYDRSPRVSFARGTGG